MKITNITRSIERGRRPYQEDRSVISLNAHGTLLAVFDGHGGDAASDFCEKMVDGTFIDLLDNSRSKDIESVLHALFDVMAFDLQNYQEGTTASVVFIPEGENVAYTAVTGDSPIIIGSKETGYWFGPDHNVRSNPEEAAAAIQRGGIVHNGFLFRNYSGDGLQMTRALGDAFLGSVLSNEPEINKISLEGTKFILVATDGIFDPSHRDFTQAAAKVIKRIEQGEPAEGLTKCAVEEKTGDNATAILARIE